MVHDARHRVFVVCIDWTAVHTCRMHTMMTGRRDRLLHRLEGRSTKKHADIAPRLVVVKSVEIMACGNTRLATGAGVQIDGESILITGRRARKWNQVAVVLRLHRPGVALVSMGENGDRRQKFLLA